MERHRRRLVEAVRFLVVGSAATVVSLILFNLLVHGFASGGRAPLADHVLRAYVLANTIGMVVSYRGTRSWAFRDRPPVQADGGRVAFVLINLVTMLLPIGCLAFTRNVLGLDDPISDNLAANVVGLFLGLVARFYLFRMIIFRRPPSRPQHHEHEGRDPRVEDVSDATGPSTSAPARRPAP